MNLTCCKQGVDARQVNHFLHYKKLCYKFKELYAVYLRILYIGAQKKKTRNETFHNMVEEILYVFISFSSFVWACNLWQGKWLCRHYYGGQINHSWEQLTDAMRLHFLRNVLMHRKFIKTSLRVGGTTKLKLSRYFSFSCEITLKTAQPL